MKRKRSFLNRAQEIASFLPINLCSPKESQLKKSRTKEFYSNTMKSIFYNESHILKKY